MLIIQGNASALVKRKLQLWLYVLRRELWQSISLQRFGAEVPLDVELLTFNVEIVHLLFVLGRCIHRLLKVCLLMDLALICVLIRPWENLSMFCILILAIFLCLTEICRAFLPIL